ncbi:hypothetical protein ASPWEDRAFT_36840 [Aspergillus wentii DTO 134E9]|uniref:Uncharacterized protein n=1 Tax=Aspergillus wentii DTO 134E9 TaxID=1073089 RepID=A0A1L9RW83_ASPWE|nr:uncharacterized protein ASPWEDRAFT_36840 [Aspergillus wentii DTO 134E9]OJJ39117.1 hypothetical protein ASPWEDRAFT_36840 [Aspergillus wentii DTO 134E9]
MTVAFFISIYMRKYPYRTTYTSSNLTKLILKSNEGVVPVCLGTCSSLVSIPNLSTINAICLHICANAPSAPDTAPRPVDVRQHANRRRGAPVRVYFWPRGVRSVDSAFWVECRGVGPPEVMGVVDGFRADADVGSCGDEAVGDGCVADGFAEEREGGIEAGGFDDEGVEEGRPS